MVGLAGCADSVADDKGAPGVAQDVPKLLLDRAVDGLLQTQNKQRTHAVSGDKPFRSYRRTLSQGTKEPSAGRAVPLGHRETCIPWLPSKRELPAACVAHLCCW